MTNQVGMIKEIEWVVSSWPLAVVRRRFSRDDERYRCHRQCDNRCSAEDYVQVQSRPRLQRADAKSGDAVTDLVKRNQAASRRSGDGRQFFLAGTDG